MYCNVRTEFKRKHCCPTFKNIKIIPHRDKREALDLHKTLLSLSMVYPLQMIQLSASLQPVVTMLGVRKTGVLALVMSQRQQSLLGQV